MTRKDIIDGAVGVAELVRGLRLADIVRQHDHHLASAAYARVTLGPGAAVEATDYDCEFCFGLAERPGADALKFLAFPPAIVGAFVGGVGDIQVEVGDNYSALFGPVGGVTNTFEDAELEGIALCPKARIGRFVADDCVVDVREFGKALRAVLPFCAKDCGRSYLQGVLFTAHEGHLRLVATDGHTLSLFDMSGVDWSCQDVVIDGACLQKLARLIEASPPGFGALGYGQKDNCLHFTSARGEWSFAAGSHAVKYYPDYKRVIPECGSESWAFSAAIKWGDLSSFNSRAEPDHAGGIPAMFIDPDACEMSHYNSLNSGWRHWRPIKATGFRAAFSFRALVKCGAVLGDYNLVGLDPLKGFLAVGSDVRQLCVIMGLDTEKGQNLPVHLRGLGGPISK